jgi:hypothetical protein
MAPETSLPLHFPLFQIPDSRSLPRFNVCRSKSKPRGPAAPRPRGFAADLVLNSLIRELKLLSDEVTQTQKKKKYSFIQVPLVFGGQ